MAEIPLGLQDAGEAFLGLVRNAAAPDVVRPESSYSTQKACT